MKADLLEKNEMFIEEKTKHLYCGFPYENVPSWLRINDQVYSPINTGGKAGGNKNQYGTVFAFNENIVLRFNSGIVEAEEYLGIRHDTIRKAITNPRKVFDYFFISTVRS